MKTKQFLLILMVMAFIIAGCGATGGTEPSAVDEPTEEPTTDPNEPVDSDDPTAEPTEAPVEEGDVIVSEAVITGIDIRILESFPVQVQVEVAGELGDGCTELGSITTERDEDTFFVTIETTRPADAICTQQLVLFSEVISLDVAGLEAGTYTVDVNGVTETFTLDVDNVLPEEAGEESELAPEDKAELIRLALEAGLVEEQLPDLALLESQEAIILSTENIDAGMVPDLPGIELVLMSQEEIQARANEEGDFLYLHFDEFRSISPDEAELSLSNRWAVAEDSEVGYLSGGGFTMAFTRGADGWTGEITSAWIS